MRRIFDPANRDALLDEGLSEEHHWVPNSGWITFRIRNEQGLKHVVWLLRLSYLRYTLKADSDPRGILERESRELHLSPGFRSLLNQFVPATANRDAA